MQNKDRSYGVFFYIGQGDWTGPESIAFSEGPLSEVRYKL
jgi:hypothetical protein